MWINCGKIIYMRIIPTKTSLFSFDDLISRAEISSDHSVVDIGCGRSISFLYLLHQIAGKEGKITGIDILPEIVDSVLNDLKHHSLNNISILLNDAENHKGITIPDKSADRVFLINTLSQASSSEAMLAEALRILKTKGKIMIVDWNESPSPIGPLQSQRLLTNHLKDIFEILNLSKIDEFEAGKYHYGFLLTK